MPWIKWLPWRFMVRRIATSHGFLDPISVLARLRRFAEPSEVAEPVELLRAGMVFHARGLINSRVIEHNLDWVWPFWVERQFDPHDNAFIPRAFSLTHCNLSHRNWTAVGWPGCEQLPIVDPRGLLTPHLDGWSLDAWVIPDDDPQLLPSRALLCRQQLDMERGIAVVTESRQPGTLLRNRVYLNLEHGKPVCRMEVCATSNRPGWVVIALRPFNPEGVSFIHRVTLDNDRHQWLIDQRDRVIFDQPVARHHVSDYRGGDVNFHLREPAEESQGRCAIGMVTAAAMFPLQAERQQRIVASIPLPSKHGGKTSSQTLPSETWSSSLTPHCQLRIPDTQLQFLYEAAVRTLILHSPGDVYPGPYTYKRFWFRDAAFIIQALLYAGLNKRAKQALQGFFPRQKHNGYFHSQEGEWDSNGEVLWILQRYCELSGTPPPAEWRDPIRRAAKWIHHKRTRGGSYPGLLPPGFSAEHLGPNDFYYWDDFWGIAGLRAAAALFRIDNRTAEAQTFEQRADDFQHCLDRHLDSIANRLGSLAMPASPNRRLDAGAIGSLAVGYPLQLCAADDPRLLATTEFLMEHCLFDGGFFQDIVHSGINPYLTLHIAQVLLRAEDPRYMQLLTRVAELASSTGQWPEAIHPRSGGGCMGDGQHAWAAAEWVAMLRNCMVREEQNHLVLAAGVPRRWLDQAGGGEPIEFGPTPTRFGTLKLTISSLSESHGKPRRARVSWSARWHGEPPRIEVRLPGFQPVTTDATAQFTEVQEALT